MEPFVRYLTVKIPEITIRVENRGDSAIARVQNTIFPNQLTPQEASQIKVTTFIAQRRRI